MPKPVRKYDAMELSVNRRFSKGMFGSFSYVYSRLYGNYAGLASSDEITSPAIGQPHPRTAQQLGGSIARPGGNVNRAWDLDEVLFDSHGTVDIKGRLATDRPHVFKLYGNKEFNWKSDDATDIGFFQYAGSGTRSRMVVQTVNQIPIMVEGRGNMGRTPFLTQTDFMVGHTIKIRRDQATPLRVQRAERLQPEDCAQPVHQLEPRRRRGRRTARLGHRPVGHRPVQGLRLPRR